MARRVDDDRHLHIVCFIAHQFYRLQDTLTDIVLKVVQTTLNAGKRHHKEQYYAARSEQRRAVRTLVDSVDRGALSPLKTIEALAFGFELSDTEKVQRIQQVLTQGSSQRRAAQDQLTTFKTQAEREANDADYYDVLAAESRKLQNRVADIVKALAFQGDESSDLMIAIQHYKAKDGQITTGAPLGFLEPQEHQAVLEDSGTSRVSLYKALLFIKIAGAIKAVCSICGSPTSIALWTTTSSPGSGWEHAREALLERAGLAGFADPGNLLADLDTSALEQYQRTNRASTPGRTRTRASRADGSLRAPDARSSTTRNHPRCRACSPRSTTSPCSEVLATVDRHSDFLAAVPALAAALSSAPTRQDGPSSRASPR